jgi:hypothetical protein
VKARLMTLAVNAALVFGAVVAYGGGRTWSDGH